MKRRLFNILSILSLVLCLATLVTWLASASTLPPKGYGHSRIGWHFWAAGVLVDYSPNVGQHYSVTVPYELSFFLSLILPVLWLMSSWRRSHMRRQLSAQRCCHKCGYDLRASVDRCPECGTPVHGWRAQDDNEPIESLEKYGVDAPSIAILAANGITDFGRFRALARQAIRDLPLRGSATAQLELAQIAAFIESKKFKQLMVERLGGAGKKGDADDAGDEPAKGRTQ